MINKSVLLSMLVIGIVATIAGTGTWAFISDVETSEGNTITTGLIDLEVNGGGILNDGDEVIPVPVLVTIDDMKPGRTILVQKNLILHNNPGHVTMMITDLVDGQGVHSEPEKEFELTHPGSENWGISEITFYDLAIVVDANDNGVKDENEPFDVLIPFNEQYQYRLDHVADTVIDLGVIEPEVQILVFQSFHMKEAGVDQNWVQGDNCTFTEVFYAEQLDYTSMPYDVIGPNLAEDEQ